MKKMIVIFLVLSFFAPGSLAVRVTALYQAETQVADKRESTRNKAIKTALRIVLVKLTGDRRAYQQPQLGNVVKHAAKYVQQFSYREVKIKTKDEAATAMTQLRLQVTFDEDILSHDLHNTGVALWANERPAILVWLLVQDGKQRILGSLEDTPDLVEILYHRAAQRGVSLLFPLMDIQDRRALQASDIWGGFREPVEMASARYSPDITITANISSPFAGLWEANWTAYREKEIPRSWNTESDLLALTLDEGLDTLIDSLALEYTNNSGLSHVRLTVNKVFSAADYSRLLRYLESLSTIQDVSVEAVQADQIILSLTAHGGDKAVSQAISLGRTLQVVEAANTNVYEMLP